FMFITCMAIAFIALYFVEDSIRFAISNYQGPLSKFFTYAEDVFVTGGARFCVGLLSYIFIFIPITILGLKWLRLFIKKRKIPMMKWEDIFVSSFLLTGVINIIIYAGLGFVDFKYFIMFFSLSALYAISRIKLPKFDLAHRIPRKLPIKQVFTMILVFLFVMKFAVYFAPINNSIDEKTEEQWIADYCLYPGTESISDIRVSGEIMLLHTERGNSIFNSFVYSTNYLTRLTSGNATQFLVVNGKITYLIMNEENIDGHFSIGNWEAWSSSESVTEIVGNYQFIQKIYASPKISVWHISI
ncbi:MAG: hypothetical protein KJ773_08980, partial [Candidatus Thermoplasmatota archaeon]|nr:hypothetical protein [Candidatus Thermoplasmatota archaeon]